MSTSKGGKQKWERRIKWILKNPELVVLFRDFPDLRLLAEKGDISADTLRMIWKMEKKLHVSRLG